MDNLLTGIALAILIILQWFVIWECIKMKGVVGTHSTDLRTELGNLGSLLDEALDFISDNMRSPQPVLSSLAQPMPDLKDMILAALIGKIGMPVEHGSTTQPQERPLLDIIEEKVETETESD